MVRVALKILIYIFIVFLNDSICSGTPAIRNTTPVNSMRSSTFGCNCPKHFPVTQTNRNTKHIILRILLSLILTKKWSEI